MIEPDSVRRYLDEQVWRRPEGGAFSHAEARQEPTSPRNWRPAPTGLYEQFRPSIPEGVKGWGAKGDLDLGLIEGLARQKK